MYRAAIAANGSCPGACAGAHVTAAKALRSRHDDNPALFLTSTVCKRHAVNGRVVTRILLTCRALTPLTTDKQQNRLRCSLATVAKQRSAPAGPSVTSSPATEDRELQFVPHATTPPIGLLLHSCLLISQPDRARSGAHFLVAKPVTVH